MATRVAGRVRATAPQTGSLCGSSFCHYLPVVSGVDVQLVQTKTIGDNPSLKVVNADLRFWSEENIISCLSRTAQHHANIVQVHVEEPEAVLLDKSDPN